MVERKLRVLHIAFNDLGNGGIQNQIMEIARQTSKSVKNDIVVWKREPAFYDEEFKKYGNIFIVPHYEGKSKLRGKLDFFLRYFSVKKSIKKVIAENGPYDAVHSHKLFESAACLSAAHKAGVPVRIAHAHLTKTKGYRMTPVRFVISVYNSVYRRLIRKHATNMIGCSRDAADYVFGKGYGDVVHIGIDTDKFDLLKCETVSRKNKRLLHVGNFSVHKNQLFLVKVFSELRKLRQDVELVMVGKESEYRKNVEKLIQDNGLSDYVIIKPHDVSIPYEMANSDAFVFPSNFEGFGIVLVEAQAMGLKCFASSEVPAETNCGLVSYLKLEDGAYKWAQTINGFLQKDTLRKPVDVSEFSQETMANNILKIYCSDYKSI